MMSYEEETECTSSYRCIDPIQNFKMRVVLKPVRSRFIPVPYFHSEKKDIPKVVHDEETESDAGEDCVLGWQEKVFSKMEISKYSDLSNCETKIHEKYHEEVTKISKNSSNYSSKLFTYIDSDNYKPSDEYFQIITDGRNYTSRLAKQIDNMEISGSSVWSRRKMSRRKIVNYSPSDDFKKQNHTPSIAYQKMFIMADLGPSQCDDIKESERNNEFVLCMLAYDPVNKILKMRPSFSREPNTKAYFIGVNGQYSKRAYHYWLYHASPCISKEDLISERRIMHKILLHQSEFRKLQVGDEFITNSPDHVNLTIYGEIICARDFEYDGLSVHYMINLPDGWKCNSPETLNGMTHTSRYSNEGTAHFCQLFSIDLLFDLRYLEDFSAYLPEIYFEVLSIDKWKIYRNEGYTYITVPRNPGIHNFSLRCWRLSDNSVISELERFFLGGSLVLEDVSYVGSGSRNETRRVMSRFGLRTVPSGKLDIRLNIVHQAEAYKLEKDKKKERRRNVFGEFDTSNLLGGVNAVLEAFRQARERMLKARESLALNNAE